LTIARAPRDNRGVASDASAPRAAPPSGSRRPRRRPRQKTFVPKSARPPSARALAARRRTRRATLLWALGGGFAAVAVAALLVYVIYGRLRPRAASDEVVEVEWPSGATPEHAAELLVEEGLAESATALAVYLRATGGTGAFVPGWHLLARGASPHELRELLTRASSRASIKVVVPEGFNRFDVAARLHKLRIAGRNAFLEATTDRELLDALGIERGGAVGAESAEGYLFPATYHLQLDSDARAVVRAMVAESDRRWAALSAAHAAGLASVAAPPLGWGRRQVLTLASLIEKEAAVDEERPLIASVFYNRLLDPGFKPRRLQSDPSSAYGCLVSPELAGCAGFAGKPLPSTNQDPNNRYSTYTHDDLPPGPIANPGERSIQAALAPAATRFLYFMGAGGGRHTFSETLAAHNEAVKRRRQATQD
jgi:UPF0755 protein